MKSSIKKLSNYPLTVTSAVYIDNTKKNLSEFLKENLIMTITQKIKTKGQLAITGHGKAIV